MKVVVLTGSPHKDGTSALMADRFIDGAKAAGHSVDCFDTAFLDIHPCIACNKCACGDNPCVWKDDYTEIAATLKEADAVVLVSPLYYHTISSQLKTAIDRFFGINKYLRGAPKKMTLIITAGDADEWNFGGIKAWYETELKYLEWSNHGAIYAGGCYTLDDIKATDFPKQAYELGKAL